MNPNRKCFGRLTINDDRIDLGFASVQELIKRLVDKYTAKRYDGEQLRLVVEISDTQLTHTSLLSREAQLEAEFQSLIVPASDLDEIFPGVSTARVLEAYESESYQQYLLICDPNKRIGLSVAETDLIRDTYQSEFPDVFDHVPVWQP